MFTSLFVVILGLCFCCKESNQKYLEAPVLTGPSEAKVGDVVEFTCELPYHPMNESILLQLFDKSDDRKLLSESTSLEGEDVSFFFLAKLSHEGDMECAASPENRSYVAPVFSNVHHLRVIEPVKGAEIVILSGLQEFFEGNILELFCKLTAGKHVSYKWLLNDRPISQAQSSRFLISRTTSEDSGSYRCEASNQFNQTVFTSKSSEVEITVNDVVSTPDISLTVLKESHNYSAIVTCESTRGTPPFNFSLYNREELVTTVTSGNRSVIFQVPVVLNQHLGFLQCQANNGLHTVYSRWLPLEVVSVDGPVTLLVVPVGGEARVEVEHPYTADSNMAAVRLSCKVSRGTFPYISWSLNDSALSIKTHVDSPIQPALPYFALSDQRQTLVITKLGPEESGYYRCRARDSYDESGPWVESAAVLVQATGFFMSTIEIVAIAFCCFLILMMAVFIICVYKIDHVQAHTHVDTTNYDDLTHFDPLSLSGSRRASSIVQPQFQIVETTV